MKTEETTDGAQQQPDTLREALTEMEARKDAAYYERNQVVAALAKCFPSGVARTAIEGWSEDWHGCVYIDLPTGQVSWHFHDSQAHLFADLPPYEGAWDGHDTPEKYRRLAALDSVQLVAQQQQPSDIGDDPEAMQAIAVLKARGVRPEHIDALWAEPQPHQRTQPSEPRRCPSCGSVKWECSDCANPNVNDLEP